MKTTVADYVERAAAVIPGASLGRMQLPRDLSIVVERGQGARLWDVSGREWLDFLMGSGPLVLGHAHPEIVSTLQEQVARGTTFYALSPDIVELAEELVRAVPCAEQVKFTSTGSEAVQYALRLARAYTGRRRVLKFEGGYHGHSEYAVFSYAPAQPPDFPAAVPESLGVTEGVRQDVLVAPFNDLDQTAAILAAHGGEVAAIIVEPVQRSILPRPGFLAGLRRLADQHGAVLVFDEIVTGFRLAYGGAQSAYGVQPDLATYGKALAGGYPIAAVAGRRAIMAYTDPEHAAGKVHFSGTFNGHALAAAAALATLRVLRQPGTYERLAQVGAMAKHSLEDLLRRRGVAGQVLGGGPWFQLVLGDHDVYDYRSYQRLDLAGTKALNMHVIRQGILLNPSSKSYLSLAHSDADLEQLAAAYAGALDQWRGPAA